MSHTATGQVIQQHQKKDSLQEAVFIILIGLLVSFVATRVIVDARSTGVFIEGVMGLVFANVTAAWGGYRLKSVVAARVANVFRLRGIN